MGTREMGEGRGEMSREKFVVDEPGISAAVFQEP